MATRYIHKVDNLSLSAGGARNLANAAGFIYNKADDRTYANGDGTWRPLATDRSIGVSYFIDPQNGDNTNSGLSWGEAFASMSALDSILDHGDTIYLSGYLRENWVTPYVHDVTIIGAANTPRQATSGGTYTGGGAYWQSPASVTNTAALIKVMGQSWWIENIFFNNAATTAPCIMFFRDGETPEADASHSGIYGCKLTGEGDGVQGSGGPENITIQGCQFRNFDSSGDTAIKAVTGAGVGSFVFWKILDNEFVNNVNHISCGAGGALNSAWIIGNRFGWKQDGAVTTTLQVDLGTVAVNNVIMNNFFQLAHNETNTALMFLPQNTDNTWLNFYRSSATAANGYVALVPAT